MAESSTERFVESFSSTSEGVSETPSNGFFDTPSPLDCTDSSPGKEDVCDGTISMDVDSGEESTAFLDRWQQAARSAPKEKRKRRSDTAETAKKTFTHMQSERTLCHSPTCQMRRMRYHRSKYESSDRTRRNKSGQRSFCRT